MMLANFIGARLMRGCSLDRIHSNGVGYPIPSWRVVDIDNEDDWRRAEILKKVIFANNSQVE